MTTWRRSAEITISDAYHRAVREGKTGQEIVKAIDDAYPFGERAMHPYKMWLDARRRILGKLGLYKGKRPWTRAESYSMPDVTPGMFEE